jgi:hypothetical protein
LGALDRPEPHAEGVGDLLTGVALESQPDHGTLPVGELVEYRVQPLARFTDLDQFQRSRLGIGAAVEGVLRYRRALSTVAVDDRIAGDLVQSAAERA